METKVLTYRGQERITKKQAKEIVKFFGNSKRTPYNWIEEKEIDFNYDTIHHELTELFATIQCDRRLNAMEADIRERIAKGLTPSKSRHYKTVEEGMIQKLMDEAVNLYKKETGNREYMNLYEKRHEIYRYFGIKYEGKTIENVLAEAREKTKGITKPDTLYKLTNLWSPTWDASVGQTSTLKNYYIRVKEITYDMKYKFNFEKSKLKDNVPFVRWVSTWDGWKGDPKDKSIHIQLYDHANRNWGIQLVINELIKMGFTTEKNFDVV